MFRVCTVVHLRGPSKLKFERDKFGVWKNLGVQTNLGEQTRIYIYYNLIWKPHSACCAAQSVAGRPGSNKKKTNQLKHMSMYFILQFIKKCTHELECPHVSNRPRRVVKKLGSF